MQLKIHAEPLLLAWPEKIKKSQQQASNKLDNGSGMM